MYLRYEKEEISFNVDLEKNLVTAKKSIHNRIYTITRPLPMMSADLAMLVERFATLPDEFWLPIELN